MSPATDSRSRVPIYNALRRYLNNDEQLIAALENAYSITSEPLRITTCGLLKAGKSSLLNVLTDHLDPELFKEGGARTTTQNQTFHHQDFIFVDTPGLDAKEVDDIEARRGMEMADVLLFVHHPGTGELHSAEIDLLNKISIQSKGGPGLDKRLVVVLTWLDSISEIEAIGKTVIAQIQKNFGVEPKLYKVSCTSYKKGMLENKNKLIEYSGIPFLRQYLFDNLVNMRNTAKVLRQTRIHANRKQLMNAVVAAISERREKITSIQSKTDNAYEALVRDSEVFVNTLRSKLTAYEAIY